MIATFGGTALGDIAMVPAPFLKDPQRHSRRRRVVHVAEEPARLRSRHLRAADRDRAWKTWRRCTRPSANTIDAVFLCGTDFGTQTSAFCSVPDVPGALAAVLQTDLRLDPRPYDLEDASSTRAAR